MVKLKKNLPSNISELYTFALQSFNKVNISVNHQTYFNFSLFVFALSFAEQDDIDDATAGGIGDLYLLLNSMDVRYFTFPPFHFVSSQVLY